METLEVSRNGATVRLTEDEVAAFNGALNEVCNALDVPEFATRMGVERTEALRLLSQVDTLLKDIMGRAS